MYSLAVSAPFNLFVIIVVIVNTVQMIMLTSPYVQCMYGQYTIMYTFFSGRPLISDKAEYTGWPKKLAQLLCMSQLYQILTDLQNYCTVRIRRKFVIILSLKIPPHFNCVAILPCEMSSVLESTIVNETISVPTYNTL